MIILLEKITAAFAGNFSSQNGFNPGGARDATTNVADGNVS